MKGKSTISEVDNLGTTHYQRLDTKPCISHERSKIDMGQNTWAPKLITGYPGKHNHGYIALNEISSTLYARVAIY